MTDTGPVRNNSRVGGVLPDVAPAHEGRMTLLLADQADAARDEILSPARTASQS
jgi:hypothetical protein